jgi:type II secretory pathway pseudopilin PulG
VSARSRHEAAAGFSLAEVVVALGLLAAVLISIAGLLVLGNRQVRGGRNSSQAIAVARDVLEQMGGWGFEQTYRRFGDDGSSSVLTIDSRDPGYASQWQARLDGALDDAHATITLEALPDTGPPIVLSAARAIRIEVAIDWREGPRSRQVRLATVRM